MKSIRFLLPMLALFSLAACSGQSGSAEKASTASAVAGPEGHGPGMHHPPPGPESLLFVALHELELTADQKTKIEAAVAEVRPKGPPPSGQAGMEAHKAALAAAIRAGKVDVVALEPKGPTDAERQVHLDAVAKALTILHATLTKPQRVALVEAVTKHRASMGPGPKGDGPEGEGPKGPMMGKGGPMMGKGPMHGLLEDLDLTQEQKDTIKAKMEAKRPSEADRKAMHEQHEAMKKELDARLAKFAADDFDAKAFVTPPAGAKPPQMRHHMLDFLEVVTSVLTPAQREKLAQKIERKSEQGPPAPMH